eukprot:GFUD01124333.1.p1 GENE.GFUD01124333.1~~GFUD01124333.1.p1  ORF type:complete len:346 (+),score=64.21 GFUD01124333.1:56-1039(+)
MGQALTRAVPPGLLPVLPPLGHPQEHHDGSQIIQLDSQDDITTLQEEQEKFPDLSKLPPELAINVLRHLNATDLCLASCVWQQLATDNILWQGLCRTQWQYASIYNDTSKKPLLYRNVYLMLDEGSLTFNSDASQGMNYFITKGLVKNDPYEIARFIHGTSSLVKSKVRQYVQGRQDIVEYLVSLQNYANTFLPNALRRFFSKLEAPNDRGSYLQRLLEHFSVRFCQCNPSLGMTVDSVYVMCFSLILLSVDLSSPHVKNKMSKREFIRNTRGAVGAEGAVRIAVDDDLFGCLYDNVFLRGHVADQEIPLEKGCKQQFVPGYLALFL